MLRLTTLALVVACSGRPATKAVHSAPPPADAAVVVVRDPSARGWLGARFELGTTKVVEVVENSPAQAARLQLGDEVVSIDGATMQTSQQIVRTIGEARPGSTIKLLIRRAGKQLMLSVNLALRPADDELMRASLIDKPAPDFSAPSLDGAAATTLADLRGQVVLIDFWATWCGPCTTQFPHLNAWHQQYASRGLRIVALSDEEPELVREYVAAEKLTYPIALDPDSKIRGAYFVPGMPATVIIDRTGVVRHVAVGTTDPADTEAMFTQLLR